jgi:CheY-like chemotaxis protein
MHILLIEDDPFIARAVSAALESEAHVVTYAPTGSEGLAALRVHESVVLLRHLEASRLPDLFGAGSRNAPFDGARGTAVGLRRPPRFPL